MNNINEIITKPVLTIYEGEIVGNIDGIIVDKKIKKILYYTIEDDRYIMPSSIYTVGKNAIVVKNMSVILDEQSVSGIPLPLGIRVYNMEGEYIGKVRDISVKESGAINTLIMDNDECIEVSKILSASKNSIITMSANTTVKRSSFMRKTEKPAETIQTVVPNVVTPRTSANISFLIGKICLKDIKGMTDEVIIKKGTKINTSLINIASQNGKLKELMLNFN